jgi:hypothetical protein
MQSMFSTKRVVYSSPMESPNFNLEVEQIWESIRRSADRMGMISYIPKDFRQMNETKAG